MVLLVSVAGTVQADDETGWSDTAEFSLVGTGGNSESVSFGFKNTLIHAWEKSSLTIKAGGIRVETTTFDRKAEGGVVTETKTSETKAENYHFGTRYERKLTDRFFWYSGFGWDRNEFAGVKNRYAVEGGLGNTWIDTDDLKFKTSYGVTYTDQEDVNRDPTVEETFLGGRFSWDYLNEFGESTTYTNTLVVDLNLDETSDWRADMKNGLAVAMNDRLALKIGLRVLFDNEPAIELVPNDLPPPAEELLRFPLEELDTILTVSLVVNFL
jgi:putative salt-induced outer membrane protein YdiY